ncbi:MAG: hypothetical protein BGO21_17950 [Dyadobacter sp. 50-39]|nr:hypothetical protein [Dyadobacter sp. 50-39]OJV14596.1 MAG: hypothetical protein BGO21_17950 [Dyadobacter sp. 50-39]
MRRTYLGEFEEIVLLLSYGANFRHYVSSTSEESHFKAVVVAMIVASPVAYYTLTSWLQKYEYHTGLPWSVFVWTGLVHWRSLY